MFASRRPAAVVVLSLLLVVSACADCGGPLSDGGTALDDGGARDAGTKDDGGRLDGGNDAGGGGDAGPTGLPPFQYTSTCDVDGVGVATPAFDVEDAFPGLTFANPLFMTSSPASSRLFVIEQGGMIYGFDPSDPVKQPFLDLTAIVEDGGEKGLLGLAFHPDFATNRFFYVSYTKRESDNKLYSIISRFTTSAASLDIADETSEYELLRVFQPYNNHNGGMISFGPDGYLYIGLGDGGDGGDPDGYGQNTTELLGSMLRIDVDTEDAPKRYSIPPGNFFAQDTNGNQPEIFAWGLRNPWRWSFDAQSGDLWIADVGQGTWEEVNHVPSSTIANGNALNFGWNVREGFVCYPPGGSQDCSADSWAPELAYHHDEGVSITGGYVYRGSSMPQHVGKYLYGDYVSRSVWVYDPATQTGDTAPAFTAPQNISSFAVDADGELYLLGYAGTGRIWRVVDNGGAPPAAPPATLSDTGCFTDLATLSPAAGVVPYDVNLQLWSDGAEKQRWLVLPSGGKVTFDEDGKWQVPNGTVLIKHFTMDTTKGEPSTRVRLETRFMIVEDDGVRGFTYRWREDGSDADLLAAGDTRDLQLILEEGAAPTSYTWTFPSPGQCLQCHTAASGGVLGLETAQLNRDNTYGPVTLNQLDALEQWSLFQTSPPVEPAVLERFATMDDDTASVAARARAWLHVNCAQCHLPGGPTGRPIDLRYTTALEDMSACDVGPTGPDYGISGVRLIKPGEPDASLLHYRDAATTAPARMPPLGTRLVDEEALAVQRQWIEALTGCTE